MKNIFFVILLATFIAGIAVSNADIYSYVDENGVMHFTNIPADKNFKKIMSEDNKRLSDLKSKRPDKQSPVYDQIIHSKSLKYNIEPSLVNAVIKVESNWNSKAVSGKGAKGLMQLMPSTARELNVKNPFNPEENIEGGVKYLRYLLDKFDGDLSLALAAYNAGPDAIKRFRGIPPFPETRKYVKRVLSLYKGGSGNTDLSPIYKVIYNDGSILYTNTPPPNRKSIISSF